MPMTAKVMILATVADGNRVMTAGTIVATSTAPGGMWKRGLTRERLVAPGIIPSRANE
jgi:hypothetical protein